MRSALLLVAIVMLAGCGEPASPPTPAEHAQPETHEETTDIPADGYYNPPFGAQVPFRVRATIDVLEGGAIDAFLATQAECGNLGRREFAPTARALNVTTASIEAEFPAGGACLMLDNAAFGYGEARAAGPVKVHWRLDVWAS